jgi:hypothetical protein
MTEQRNPPPGEGEGHNHKDREKSESKETQASRRSNPKPPRERWRNVPGMAGLRVSSRGRVKGAEVHLCEGRRVARGVKVCRLVWLAFVGPIPENLEVHHRDNDRTNDALENLECVTASQHAIKEGRAVRIKFPPWVIADAWHRRQRGESADSIEAELGVSWRHQRHLLNCRDRRKPLLYFLETGWHPYGQGDLFGPSLEGGAT